MSKSENVKTPMSAKLYRVILSKGTYTETDKPSKLQAFLAQTRKGLPMGRFIVGGGQAGLWFEKHLLASYGSGKDGAAYVIVAQDPKERLAALKLRTGITCAYAGENAAPKLPRAKKEKSAPMPAAEPAIAS